MEMDRVIFDECLMDVKFEILASHLVETSSRPNSLVLHAYYQALSTPDGKRIQFPHRGDSRIEFFH